MVTCLLGDITRKLGDLFGVLFSIDPPDVLPNSYLDLALEFSLEARPNNLPLTGFQTISNRRDRSNVISHGEKNELLVDEVGDRDLSRIVIQVGARLRTIRSGQQENVENHKPSIVLTTPSDRLPSSC